MAQQNAAQAGLALPDDNQIGSIWLMSVLLGLIMAIFGGAAPALAGDLAQPRIIGYSQDLRYFAYEEFGIADASGFPYSNIYFVDLKANSPVPGSPVRIILDEEADPLEAELVRARSQAREKARPFLDRLQINWPAQMLAYNGDGVPDLEALSLRFGPTAYNGSVLNDYRLSLEMVATDKVLECESWEASKPQVFVLTIRDADLKKREIYRNQILPDSKDCPLFYKISGVFVPFQATDISDAIALISVYSSGWEGPDRRFIVVPIGRYIK